jgi:DNA (cytosine-5)-methyltransferase 1
MTRPLVVGSLYTGVAGLDVGVAAALHEAGIALHHAWMVERDPFCQRVLAHHFPAVYRYGDVESVDRPGRVDLLVGGFVCTDVSAAGAGKGMGRETRSGNTWWHLRRIVGETEPEAVVVENVASGARRWLPKVVRELRRDGYRCHAVPLGAVHVGAPHRRLRIFLVAVREGAVADAGGAVPGRQRCLPEDRHAPHGHDAARRRAPVSDTGGRLLRQQPGGRRGAHGTCPREPGVDGAALADADGGRSRSGTGLALPSGQRDAGSGRFASELSRDLGDAAGARREGPDGDAFARGAAQPPRARRRLPFGPSASVAHAGAPLPSLGQRSDGLPFDVARHAFPAGRGQTPYPWEPPRAVAPDVVVPDRPAKLRALGNAVVPQCGLVVGRILVALRPDWAARFGAAA